MDSAFKARLKQLIVSHEDSRNYPYTDTKGNITIGIGYNLSARGLPDTWINQQYDEDVEYFDQQLRHDFPWYDGLIDVRKMVLIDMCFRCYKTFCTFHKLIFALELRNNDKAADEILNSLYAEQAPNRALENANIMRSGVYVPK